MTAGRVEALIVIPTGGLALSAQNSVGGPTTVTIAGGTTGYWTSTDFYVDMCQQIQDALNAQRPSGWTVTYSSTTGQITINCTNAPWSITWTSTVLRNLLGFTANISGVSAPQTGTRQARGLWRPDCVLDLAGHPAMAPMQSDLRATRSPRGLVISHVGNAMYRHKSLRWAAVPHYRYRSLAADLIAGDWETFVCDTQIAQAPPLLAACSSCFSPGARVQIYDHAGTRLGSDLLQGSFSGVSGWFMQGLSSTELVKQTEFWTGLWRVEIAEIVSDG